MTSEPRETLPPDHIYTWIDVDDHLTALAQVGWPDWLLEADAFWEGLELRVLPTVALDDIRAWLTRAFGVNSVDFSTLSLRMDVGAAGEQAGASRLLPISIERQAEVPPHLRVPRLRERRIVRGLAFALPRPAAPSFAADRQIVAFHSFKGGVGRTVQALALADALAQRAVRVLVIDADLEAPGITWMLDGQSRRIDFAFEDFLALLHGTVGDDPSDAIDLARRYLANQEFGSIVVMPATRRPVTPIPPRIDPADLLTPERSPYFVTESIAKLAEAIAVPVVIADLRAGSTELSAPILLDPRVQRVFVTTLSHQAMRGTTSFVREVGRRSPALMGTDPPPMGVITQFDAREHAGQLAPAAAELRDALEDCLVSEPRAADTETVDADLVDEPILVPFDPRLLALPGRWDEVLSVIRATNLASQLERLTQALEPFVPELSMAADEDEDVAGPIDLKARRERLSTTAQSLAYAETSTATDFLVTEPIRNLLTSHRAESPLVVLVGAKGSGKTFTFVQMCLRGNWRAFGEAAGITGITTDSSIVPVLTSVNLSDALQQQIQGARLAATPTGTVASQLELRELVKSHLSGAQMSDTDWRRVWLAVLARSAGAEATPADAEEVLAALARSRSAVFVLDGLEDIFLEFSSDAHQQQALRVLLIDTLDWLRSLRGRPLGLVVFVRADLVQWAVRQNTGQFLAKYSEFALRWNAEEALRLVLWLCTRARALPRVEERTVMEGRGRILVELLLPVWGEKMGGPKSREARSDQWFLAALSDFNQQIQARDIVWFIHEAADQSIDDTRWPARLLAPTAMRNALLSCSREKIKAIADENPRVGDLLKRLSGLESDLRRVPFEAQALGLASDEIEILAASGVVFREDDRYWIPEIFRHGLGFRAERRPKILAVANLVRRRNNLD